MVEVEMVESLARTTCGIALLFFVFIAILSRSEKAEQLVQRLLSVVCFTAAGLLGWLSIVGGEFYGSSALPPVLVFACVIIGLGAGLNIRGIDLSQGMNPHQIMKMIREEE